MTDPDKIDSIDKTDRCDCGDPLTHVVTISTIDGLIIDTISGCGTCIMECFKDNHLPAFVELELEG